MMLTRIVAHFECGVLCLPMSCNKNVSSPRCQFSLLLIHRTLDGTVDLQPCLAQESQFGNLSPLPSWICLLPNGHCQFRGRFLGFTLLPVTVTDTCVQVVWVKNMVTKHKFTQLRGLFYAFASRTNHLKVDMQHFKRGLTSHCHNWTVQQKFWMSWV